MLTKPKPSPIDEEFVRSESENSLTTFSIRVFVNVLISSFFISAIFYVSAQMFVVYAGPGDYLAHLIANMYVAICQMREGCSLPYLNAALVGGMDLVALAIMVFWSAFSAFDTGRDEFGDVHEHLKLISDQIRTDINGLDAVNKEIVRIYKDMAELGANVNVLSDMVKASDERVDMVVEVKRPEVDDAGEAAPAA